MPTSTGSSEKTSSALQSRRRARAAIALARARLSSTRLAKLGFAAGLAMTGMFGVFAIVLRASEGAGAPLEGLIESCALSVAMLAATPTALAAASNRRAEDRDAGIEALAAMRGIPMRTLEGIRVAAAMSQIGRSIAVPMLVLTLLTVALAGSAAMALRRCLLALGLVTFSAIVGVTLGSIATLSARFGGRRSRALFLAIVLVPWMIAEMFGRGMYSIPGALNAALSFLVDLSRGGA